MQATALPVIVIAVGIVAAYEVLGDSLYGIAAAMAQLSMTGLIVALDAYGPVTDNAGGIAEMADLDESVRASPTCWTRSGTRRRRSRRATRPAPAGLAALILFDEYARGLNEENVGAASRSTTPG